jgi:hypothetical protein
MSKGQQAIVVARANRVSGNPSQRDVATQHGIGQDRIHRALTILDHAPGLADRV